MSQVSKTKAQQRQKTLLASFLVSVWAPLATGVAAFLNPSATQLADFLRRSTELLALLLSWLVFRYLAGGEELAQETQAYWERVVNLSIAVALAFSGLILLFLAFFRLGNYKPGGSVTLGLIIAVLGLTVNFWFWRRYSALERESPSLIINAQRRLYLAKISVDLGVISALSAVALAPASAAARYIDSLGSALVAVYLLWSAWRTWGGVSEGEARPGGGT